MKAHRTFLIPYQADKFLGRPTPLFYHQRTVPDIEAQVGEWVVEKVLKHRKTPKGFEFLTQRKNFPSMRQHGNLLVISFTNIAQILWNICRRTN